MYLKFTMSDQCMTNSDFIIVAVYQPWLIHRNYRVRMSVCLSVCLCTCIFVQKNLKKLGKGFQKNK